jgi:hypothetical protein
VRRVHRNYHGPLHTGFAQLILEDPSLPEIPELAQVDAHA